MSFSCRQWRAGPVAAAGALVVALTVGPAQAQDKTFTMKITTPTLNAALDLYARAYGAAVEKDSGGRIKVEVYPASQLGAIPRQIEGVQFGAIQCAVIPPEFFVGVDERFEVLAAPGLVTSAAQGHRVAADPAVQKFYLGLGAEKGLHGVAVAYAEPSEVVAKSAIRHLADFKGKKIRIFASEFQSASFKRLGTTPVAMSPGDVMTALQQGSLDASVAGVELLSGLHFYDAAKYITLTNHAAIFYLVELSKKWFDTLPPRSAADRRERRRRHCHEFPAACHRDRRCRGEGLDRRRRRICQPAGRRAGGITEDAVQRRRRYFEGETGARRGL
jgi:TRAP-type C4-dicarboxylate transport system substrate-binding protein